MTSSKSTMGHRGGQNYLKALSSPSSKLLPSSPTHRKALNQKVTLPFNLKNSKSSVVRPSPNLLNISRPSKHHKMSSSSSSPSKKRTSEDEPFEIEPSDPTGLEAVLSVPSKKRCLTISNPVMGVYTRRKKVAKYTAMIRQKKALASQTSQSLSRMPVNSQRGMRNPMSLCYRISLFQALLHQPKLVNFLLDSHHPEDCVSDHDDECLPCAFRLLVQGYWKVAPSPAAFPKVFRGIDGLFSFLGWSSDVSSGQADPEEQAAWMFGAMRNAMPSSSFAFLASFMELTTTSSIKCKCGHESRTEGHSDRALPVAITPKIPNGTLSHYLQRYMVEVIDGYKCEKCKDESKKNRVQLIEHAPDILAVQLKRFRWDGQKDSSVVGINPLLNLDKYKSDDNKDHLEYQLTAIIKHAGSSGFGHYICSAKSSDGVWYCFNDEKVSKSSLTEAMTGKGFTPYVIFYQRKET